MYWWEFGAYFIPVHRISSIHSWFSKLHSGLLVVQLWPKLEGLFECFWYLFPSLVRLGGISFDRSLFMDRALDRPESDPFMGLLWQSQSKTLYLLPGAFIYGSHSAYGNKTQQVLYELYLTGFWASSAPHWEEDDCWAGGPWAASSCSSGELIFWSPVFLSLISWWLSWDQEKLWSEYHADN